MAIFNNGYPATYQNPYMSQPPYQYQTPTQHNNSLIWVQGEAGAKSYLVAPNTTVQLWDSESQTIYLKSADASGMPSMKVLDYTIRDNAPANAPAVASAPLNSPSAYATKEDVEALYAQISGLKKEIDSISARSAKEAGNE